MGNHSYIFDITGGKLVQF